MYMWGSSCGDQLNIFEGKPGRGLFLWDTDRTDQKYKEHGLNG